jgi:hypothetical protein
MWAVSGQSQERVHVPSDHRGDPNFRRFSNLDGNNIRASVFNSGYSGAPNQEPESIPYEWPKNTNRIYVSIVGIWLGGEVANDDGNTINIIDMPAFRSSPQGNSWTMEPVPGFQNPGSEDFARSDDPSTWPPELQGGWRDKREDPNDPGWVGSWNGFFGKNIFNADQEMYFRTSDDLYDRYNYTPDETDPSRKGLGLLMDVRSFAWSQILISDVVFFVHDIKNDGTKRIPKSSFLIFIADWVGGDGQDDEPFVDIQTDVTFLTDADRIGIESFGGSPVGVAAIKYIETPGNQVDGIDNDGDADNHPELISMISGDPDEVVPIFNQSDFSTRLIAPGDKIVLIDSLTFERRVIAYPAGGGTVRSLGRDIVLPPEGMVVAEDTTANTFDEDFDGLIDESVSLHLLRFDEILNTTRPVRHVNYLSFAVGDTIKRGFLVPGKNAEWNYQNVAPMIDEARDDGFDNDNDWQAFFDDNGLDGARDSGDEGEGDGLPTSGAGTDFPGEPNIDNTDVAETDLIGLTSAVQIPLGAISFQTTPDKFIWDNFMSPGVFDLPRPTGEYDTFVSSAFFPLDPGQRQRMAVSVAIAGGGINTNADLESVIRKQEQARLAYEADYQFAQAPLLPEVKAVARDGQVALYWDDTAEFSQDRYIRSIGGNPDDFEGYRIYRATDAAFTDARVITDAFGTITLMKPIAQFDLADGRRGLHPVAINGVQFDLGQDTGIVHSYVDNDVVNGQRYFYAVTAFDFGYEPGNIPPTETPIRVDVDLQGNITMGKNVVVVRPGGPSAGYLPPEVKYFDHAQGTATGMLVISEIVDPGAVQDGHEYQITFADTLIPGARGDTLTTRHFTVTDVTENKVELSESRLFNESDEIPIIDGFQLRMQNERIVQLNSVLSGWSRGEVFPFVFEPVSFPGVVGEARPNDYRLIMTDGRTTTSKDTTIGGFPLPGIPAAFSIERLSDNQPVEFAFVEIHGNDGRFSVNPTNSNFSDTILLLERNASGQLAYTWQITMRLKPSGVNPEPGDTLNIRLNKPFLSQDIYRFGMKGPNVSMDIAREAMDDIRVVPNPYIAAETWEPRNTFSSGRGPREIHFINLPARCTIRIFSVDGTLVDIIEHDAPVADGTAIWDVLSKENLDIAYGIYFYHVEAPGIGAKKGTFAIIK